MLLCNGTERTIIKMKNTKTLRKKLGSIKRTLKTSIQEFLYYVRRKSLVAIRKIISPKKHYYTFGILCIKHDAYARLVINQANSLHYFNPMHRFEIWVDDICAEYFEKHRKSFDYPQRIIIKNMFGKAEKPWQQYKMDMFITLSRNGALGVDADTIWHSDLVFDNNKIHMFAPAHLFGDSKVETSLIMNLFHKPEWLSFMHFVSAFLYIPPHLMTEKLAQDAKTFLETILSNPLTFLPNESDRISTHRISEQIAFCLALQSNYPGMVATLKDNDSRKNRKLAEPLYYGCENNIIR